MSELLESTNLQIPLHLRPWELEGPAANVMAQASMVMPEDDFLLFRQTAILAEETGIEEDVQAKALGLVLDFYLSGPEDEKFAKGSMESLPLMLSAADALEDSTGVDINRGKVWLGVLHDIGKAPLDETTKHRSNIGAKDYSEKDMSVMEQHVVLGAVKAIFGGVPQAAPLSATHHERQPRNPYTVNIETTHEDDLATLCIAIGDHVNAAKTRSNNRTSGFRRSIIWSRARDAVRHALNDFPEFRDGSSEYAEIVMGSCWSRTELRNEIFDQELAHAHAPKFEYASKN